MKVGTQLKNEADEVNKASKTSKEKVSAEKAGTEIKAGIQLRNEADEVNKAKAKAIAVTLHNKVLKKCKSAAHKGEYEIELTSENGFSALYKLDEVQLYMVISTLDMLLKDDEIELLPPDSRSSTFGFEGYDAYRASFGGRKYADKI